jgi:hypothetical protein
MGNAGRAGADQYRPPITPFAGWVADERTNRLRPLETAPHIGAFGPAGWFPHKILRPRNLLAWRIIPDQTPALMVTE